MDALTVTHLALAPLVDEQGGVDRHELRLEEVSQLAAELSVSLSEVERLGEVDVVRDVEAEGDGGRAGRADVVIQIYHHAMLPDTSLPNVWISLPLVTVVNLLARVD